MCITGVSSFWDQGSKPRWALYAAAEFTGPCVGSPCAPAAMVSLATGPGVSPPPLLAPYLGNWLQRDNCLLLLVPVDLLSWTYFSGHLHLGFPGSNPGQGAQHSSLMSEDKLRTQCRSPWQCPCSRPVSHHGASFHEPHTDEVLLSKCHLALQARRLLSEGGGASLCWGLSFQCLLSL